MNVPVSENRKTQLDLLALNIIDTVWPKYNHGVPMVYGDYETHYDDDGEGYHVYENEPYPLERNVGLKSAASIIGSMIMRRKKHLRPNVDFDSDIIYNKYDLSYNVDTLQGDSILDYRMKCLSMGLRIAL